ncbi:hypothetical protein H7F10_13265 [Acidithiobacillus sp. HP-6]|uniref:hypothetical protein n=1 Tax=unclassified Acidithiobacillus TaxID=2614800 RepID=UPI00187B0B0D|nr:MULTISPECIES: hypothetical protein [unclassified Acidithiobacillus]MBE7563894.1 hypothetical protein [Acidithiobacillus sp. HP-6]MBE7569052.1 hypothetical protein [Acidithiobacillus sp. HP-2]
MISKNRAPIHLNRFMAKSLLILSAIVLAGCSTNAKGIHKALEKHLSNIACTKVEVPLSIAFKNPHNSFPEENSKQLKRMQYLVKSGLFSVFTKSVKHKVWNPFTFSFKASATARPEKIFLLGLTAYGKKFLAAQSSMAHIVINHRELVKVNHYTTPRVNSFVGLKMTNVSYDWKCSAPPKWATTKEFQHLFNVKMTNYAKQYRSQTTLVKKADGWTD